MGIPSWSRSFILQLARVDGKETFNDIPDISQLQEEKTVYLKEIHHEFSQMPDNPEYQKPKQMSLDFPSFPVDDDTLTNEVKIVYNALQKRILYIDEYEATGLFISPILIGTLALYASFNTENKDPLQIACNEKVIGKVGRGLVDYVVTYKNMNIILTEAKRENISGGVQLNLHQQEAIRQEQERDLAYVEQNGSARKRKHNELLISWGKVPSYGIVSTGADWILLRYCPGEVEEEKRLIRSEKMYLLLNEEAANEEAREKQIRDLLQRIAGLLQALVHAVDGVPPASKRVRCMS